MRLSRAFYARPTLDVLADLVGMVLVHETRGTRTAGLIVEAEAYIGESDPACHAAPGPTARNRPLYGPPGIAYVYLNYGMHSLVNAVTEPEGQPAAVLIRALEPLEGIEHMRRRRRRLRGPSSAPVPDTALGRGPGNLAVAMGITLGHNGRDLVSSSLWIENRGHSVGARVYSPRIGIRVGTDRLWRCAVQGHAAVTRPRG